MKISDLLRKVADQVDGAHDDPVIDQNTVDPEDTDDAQFLPPLQAKMELLKKSEGMPNVYDDAEEDDDEEHCGCNDDEEHCGCNDDEDYHNELTHIKRNAGIRVNSTRELADDDGPFEG